LVFDMELFTSVDDDAGTVNDFRALLKACAPHPPTVDDPVQSVLGVAWSGSARLGSRMAFYENWFGKGRLVAQARAAEVRGDLGKAAELFAQAGRDDEVARVLVIRGEGDPDARGRLQFFTQAARLAPEGTETNKTARLKRAELLLALAGDTTVSAVARQEVTEAARDLESIGEPLKAAEAFARAGDKEGEARALQAAGDVERLEFLLSTEQFKERTSRAKGERVKDVDVMIESGRRREALHALDELLAATPDDAPLRERANGLRARRVSAPLVTLDAAPRPGTERERFVVVTGEEVVVGRTDGSIKVSSNAISRQHLRIFRDAGVATVRDLESRNGTQLRGINLAGPLAVGEGLELRLGKEVAFRIAPSKRLEGAFEIDVAGEKYHASLGPARTPIPGIELAVGADGWIELESHGARVYIGDVELVPRASLLLGDAVALKRGGEPVLRVVAS
jgi:tetratricopeptide (TPR) repeat protein